MTLDEFDINLLTYGSNLDTWPADLQDPAKALLATGPEADRLLREMTGLTHMVEHLTQPAIAPGVVAARLQQSLTERIEEGPIWSLLPIKGLLALGSLAGVGGATAAYILAPVSANSGFFLSMAMGGLLP
jgi:hypothetical protein